MDNYTLTTCNICGGKIKELFRLDFNNIIGMSERYTQHICMCDKCKFIFTQNPFSQEKLNNRYKNYSKYEFDDEEDSSVVENSNSFIKRCKRQKYFIEDSITDFSSVLDIGAASGFNLSLYKDKRVYGIEPSRANCNNAKAKYNVDMFYGTFDEYLESGNTQKFDLITMSHILEHIINPCEFIKRCKKINTKYMYIEVPTFDFKFSNQPFGMFCDEHVNCFTFEALQNLMNHCEYTLVDANIIFDMGAQVPAGSPCVGTIWRQTDKITKYKCVNSSNEVFDRYIKTSYEELKKISNVIDGISPNDKLAIWGVGNHASMLLANTDLPTKNIVKFYDSDKKKHSFTIEGKPIQAFNPNDLTDGTVDTILIATYTAQEPILRVLAPYSNQCKIIKLY